MPRLIFLEYPLDQNEVAYNNTLLNQTYLHKNNKFFLYELGLIKNMGRPNTYVSMFYYLKNCNYKPYNFKTKNPNYVNFVIFLCHKN